MGYLRIGVGEAFGKIVVFYINLYGAANSVITLYFVKPYRNFIIEKTKRITFIITCGRIGVNVDAPIQVITERTTSQFGE